MHSNSDNNQQVALQHAFSLQYITVIIIILAFLVGTFSSRSFKNQKEQFKEVVAELPVAPMQPARYETLKSELQYSDLFNLDSLLVNPEKAMPVAMMLANHDLTAEIKINLGLCREGSNEECFQKEINAAKNLSDYLRSVNLPEESFKIYYAPDMNKTKTLISFITDENGI